LPNDERCKHWLPKKQCSLCNAAELRRKSEEGVKAHKDIVWITRVASQALAKLETIGWLVKNGRIDAQVPWHKREDAEQRYRLLTGGNELPKRYMYYGDHEKKWATSGCVRFKATDFELDSLDLGECEILEDGAEYVVNNTELFWQLVSLGARLKE
jgi:hypothetical protein